MGQNANCIKPKKDCRLKQLQVRTYLSLQESVSSFSLMRMIEPFDPYVHRCIPRFPQRNNAPNVRDIARWWDEHRSVTDLNTT